MRSACLILLATLGWAGCSEKRLHVGEEGAGAAGTGGGHAGTGVTSAGGSTGTAGSTGGGVAAAGGVGTGGGAAGDAGGAGTGAVGGGGVGGSAPTGGSGPTGGTGGAGGSNPMPPRFFLIGPIDPSGTLRTGRQYQVLLNGASDDGSMLVGSSTYYDPTSIHGVNFYWTEASGVVTLPPPPAPRTFSPWPNLTPDGTALFGYTDGGVYRWTKQAGYEFFAADWRVQAGSAASVDLAFSRDGTVVWGNYWDPTQNSGTFRWRRSDGRLVGSGLIPGWPADGGYANNLQSYTNGGGGIMAGSSPFSDDGKVVVGLHPSSSAPGPQLSRGFIWSEAGTLAELEPLPGTSACAASVLSRDGTTAFGSCFLDPTSTPIPFRWTAATGVVAIGPNGGYYSETTPDGRVAMGRGGVNAFSRWTAAAGAVLLQPPSSTFDPASYELNITTGSLSADGASIYGRAVRTDFQPGFEEESPEDAFVWRVADGFVRLAPLPGHDIATVYATAQDGSVQAGSSRSHFGGTTLRAVLWDCGGIRDIAAELIAAGIDLQGTQNGLGAVVRVWSGSSIMMVGYATAGGVAGAFIAWLPRRC